MSHSPDSSFRLTAPVLRRALPSMLLTALIMAGSFSSGGCASLLRTPDVHETVPSEEYSRTYTPDELRSDIDYLVRTLQDVHPDLFSRTPKSRFDSARWQIKRDLTAPMTRREFYWHAAPLVALLGDGHTSLSPPFEEYLSYQRQGGLLFPFTVEYSAEEGVLLSQCYDDSTGLVPGDRVAHVNGVSMDSLAALFERGVSGEQRSYREHRVAFMVPFLLWLDNIRPPYTLDINLRGSLAHVSRRTSGVTSADMRRRDTLLLRRNGSPHPYRFERTGDNIGVIGFHAMVNLNHFREFLETTFAQLKEHPVRGLIIDLRSNGGGDSRLGDALLSFLTESPYRAVQRKEWKMSAEYKLYLRRHLPWWIRWFPVTWVSPEARRYLGADDGAIIVDTAALTRPGPNPLRFRGRTCFLIGPRTFSSAMMLANAVSDHHLATLIGEETGGVPNAFGEVYPFDLPHTRLPAGVSSARFVRANGRGETSQGIFPDIEVRQTSENDRAGVDAVMERARRWILSVER
jgi:hypothetical protein